MLCWISEENFQAYLQASLFGEETIQKLDELGWKVPAFNNSKKVYMHLNSAGALHWAEF